MHALPEEDIIVISDIHVASYKCMNTNTSVTDLYHEVTVMWVLQKVIISIH